MAHNDYVARGRGKKAPPPPPKRTLPWPRIVITLSLLAAFGYFLWSIKGTAPEKPQVATQPAATQQEKDALPDMPKEEWEFITSLPEYTVEVEVEERAKSTVRYLMQCGSFKVRSQAEELKAKIAFQGLEAQVRNSEGSSWYRVILGPYESKRHAEADRHTLQRAKINGCVVWNWNL
ncbi:SPOR domain-containing protein [Paraglaciecola hydrolytica]|uniref:Cell division protein FtsN n=1 Tax=Paraglaciecola hydrolytica TaxID=1799789 RepID=A0A136A5M9_9ALTE|nr:SPOR domain-containing protein [Paraglaciecola hydrolytica]KXI30521.1 cell division protein FtsN [Paraglaciecola hydrolytica]